MYFYKHATKVLIIRKTKNTYLSLVKRSGPNKSDPVKYNNHLNYRDRRRVLLRLRIIFVVIALVLIGIAAFFYYDYMRDRKVNTDESTTSQKTNSLVTPKVNIFKSTYFQFQASNSWVEVPQESTPNKFVYRSFRTTLLEHDLVIYVNQIPPETEIKPTRVLPIEIMSSHVNGFITGEVSEPCGVSFDKNSVKDVQLIKFSNVSFLCYGKINQYNVVVGKIGGGTNINMARPDGTTAVYTIFYRDLRAVNGPAEISQVISSFQTR